MMEYPSWLQTALGYYELKMYDEAWSQIDQLSETRRQSIEALDLRIRCLLDQNRHEEALEHCREMCDRFPEEHAGYIQGAFCLHELKRTREAQAWLQSGPYSLQIEAKYFYNLGCYDLALGHAESACSWLLQAFEMEPSYYDDALKDPDFVSILPRLREMWEDR